MAARPPAVPQFEQGLNEPQRAAVRATGGATIVLAGPGSGKTRVIVSRALCLHHVLRVPAAAITAVTFTNKAADEMKARLTTAGLPIPVVTFHRLCMKMIRKYGAAIGIAPGFSVCDRSEQQTCISHILKSLGATAAAISKEDVIEFASLVKNKLGLLTPVAVAHDVGFSSVSEPLPDAPADPGRPAASAAILEDVPEALAPQLRAQFSATFSVLRTVFGRYQSILRSEGKLDFDDLLVYGVQLLEAVPAVATVISSSCQHLLVDEFQDTNELQYRIVRGMTRVHGNVFVVGDPFQCIYTWRFATPENLNKIAGDFPVFRVIALDQNYRSTSSILAVANAVIASATQPAPTSAETAAPTTITSLMPTRKLWTAATDASPVTCCVFPHDEAEALYVADEIKALCAEPSAAAPSIAILSRTIGVSKLAEKALVMAGISYRVTGGTRLFDHQEIKDVVAYLQLAYRPSDKAAFKRAIGMPRRGVGQSTIAAIEAYATSSSDASSRGNLLAACERIAKGTTVKGVGPSVWKSLGPFVNAVRALQRAAADPVGRVSDALHKVLTEMKFTDYIQREFPVDYKARLSHLGDLLACIKGFEQESDEADDGTAGTGAIDRLGLLLQQLTLQSDVDSKVAAPAAKAAPGTGATKAAEAAVKTASVTLSTVHAAKGMEWDVVFVVGAEASLFPHSRSVVADSEEPTTLKDGKENPIDEERRLLYVAVTRARKKLYITRALRRTLNGRTAYNGPCPFLGNLPADAVVVHIAEDASEAVETDENTAVHAADGGAPHEEEVDDATWQASVRAGTAVGQFRPLKRVEMVDCTVDPGQQYGLCDPGFGVVMPPPVTGIIPRPVAGFRFARDLYVAAPAEPIGSAQHKSNSVQSTARFNTPYGIAHQSNAHVEVMNGRVMLRNDVEPCTGIPDVMPCAESDVVEDAAEIAQKRLGYRSASLPPMTGTPFSYTPSVSGAASSIRKPFKRPRAAVPQ